MFVDFAQQTPVKTDIRLIYRRRRSWSRMATLASIKRSKCIVSETILAAQDLTEHDDSRLHFASTDGPEMLC